METFNTSLAGLAGKYLSPNEAGRLLDVRCDVIKKGDDETDTDECWLCTSHSTKSNGYPRMRHPHSHLMVPIQRVLWEFIEGPIAEDQVVTRTCGNKACCNPKHLKLRDKEETLEYLSQKARAEADARAA